MITIIINKELKSMFASPLAWVLIAFLQGIFAFIFMSQLQNFSMMQAQLASAPNAPGLTEIAVTPVFSIAAIVLLFSVPLLTMRLIAEERRNQTMIFLISAPVSMTQIILGKFFATVVFLEIIFIIMCLMCFSVLPGGTLDFGLLFSCVLGISLLGATFSAIGLFVSCLTNHPVVAAILSLAIALGLWIINLTAPDPDSILNLISLFSHWEPFLEGTIAVSDIAYFGLVISVFIILSIRRLDADRLHA
ncbi:MAG: ABC transporter permease [Proteobacteria bacterium]|nr:ABC transporter permease [Pseudomonadota bacterium]